MNKILSLTVIPEIIKKLNNISFSNSLQIHYLILNLIQYK